MKKIKGIKVGRDIYVFSEQIKMFSFSYFNLFLLENRMMPNKRNEIFFNSSQTSSLITGLKKLLDQLLEAGYEEPNQMHLQKYPTRYEKITFCEKVYILNYRTSEIGQLAYSIKVLMDFLDNSVIDKKEVIFMLED
ncbi:hypothetical protein HMPREF0765_4470 [Sphingobacterium spiritivorum ATCC 33300]|uniref:Uncharacterized protein n=1 Tax=Sphingobacterium spiritivorum ATCC 33300 TaxID=525372 RepID=C2G4G4_SPHSI|nr:hypothetical protein [Sphingobacterium spiritivorum]EEI89965.1 hypothetical protein HMPREF0765_4470 [Sphingobacterium spiritivorum ATCC 33300]QQS94884.1 hypothetical protein I6J03_16090 [Sphingobacterium spiritivorum]